MTVAQPRATETAVESWAEMNISWTLRTTDAVTATRGMSAATTIDQVSERIRTRCSASDAEQRRPEAYRDGDEDDGEHVTHGRPPPFR